MTDNSTEIASGVKIWRCILALAAFFCIATLLWRLLVPKTMAREAEDVLEAELSGNASKLFSYADKNQIEKQKLTPQKIRMVFDQCVAPRLRPFKRFGKVESQTNADGASGEATITLRNASGRTLEMSATPERDDDGVRYDVVFHLLAAAWRAEYVVARGLDSSSSVNIHKGRIEGLLADKEKLLLIGIPGVTASEPDGPLRTWDDLLASERELLSRYEKKIAP